MADEDTTRIITRKPDQSLDETRATTPFDNLKRPGQDDDPHTKIFRPATKDGATGIDSGASKFEGEPVVGWLVVVSGPGRGRSLHLGFGMNSIGRGPDERVSLDFGDEEISRQGHAMLTYDPKGKKFYLNHGGGVNITYVAETPVLQTLELKGREIISLGKTELCFIPFCGPEFGW